MRLSPLFVYSVLLTLLLKGYGEVQSACGGIPPQLWAHLDIGWGQKFQSPSIILGVKILHVNYVLDSVVEDTVGSWLEF